MKHVLTFLFALAALAACLVPVAAYAESFHRGQVLQHHLAVCVEKADAIEIVKADSEKGIDAAKAIWDAKEACVAIPVQGGPSVGQVVFSATIKRGEVSLTMKVVEIIVEGKVAAYFFTTSEVKGLPLAGRGGNET